MAGACPLIGPALTLLPLPSPRLLQPQELAQLRSEKLSLQAALQTSEQGTAELAAQLKEARRGVAAAQAEAASERQRRQAVESAWAAAQQTLRAGVRALSEHHGSLASLQSHLAATKRVRVVGGWDAAYGLGCLRWLPPMAAAGNTVALTQEPGLQTLRPLLPNAPQAGQRRRP